MNTYSITKNPVFMGHMFDHNTCTLHYIVRHALLLNDTGNLIIIILSILGMTSKNE